jgi:hypothetical protein
MDGPWGGLILLGVLAIPAVVMFLYMRRPFGGAPRDAMASRAKAELGESVYIIPSDAGQDLVDDAADLPDRDEHADSDL